jgi:triacylglycerol esterase/lipase EstA (alpha/beta hydrolase family)
VANPGPASPKRPVVLVHGVLGQRFLYWNLFRRELEAAGFRVFEAELPMTLLGDIREAAAQLKRHVDAALADAGAERADLVCHSAGGLVARYYAKRLGGAARIGHLVMMGTPHAGSVTSYAIPLVPVTVQSRPGSELLREVNEGPEPEGICITNLWSPADGVIIPASSTMLERPHVRNVRMPWIHHWGFLVSGRVARTVVHILRKSPRPHPEFSGKGRRAPSSGRRGRPARGRARPRRGRAQPRRRRHRAP